MTTVPSMMMPKSMAPMESRFAATPVMQKNESKKQSQRNGQRGYQGGAKAHQKENQHDQHQHHAPQQVALYRVGG